MSSGVTGDFAKMQRLMQSLGRVLKVPQKTAILFAPQLTGFLQREFDTGTDPFGEPWKPLKAVTLRKGRTPPPLTASGAARSSATATPAGVKDRASLAGYLRYHLQSRAVLPLRGETWPEAWVAAIRATSATAISNLATGKET